MAERKVGVLRCLPWHLNILPNVSVRTPCRGACTAACTTTACSSSTRAYGEPSLKRVDHVIGLGIRPEVIYCDRFSLGALKDAVAGRWPIVDRVARWSEATEVIAGFQRLVADGPLSVEEECWALARVGLSQAIVIPTMWGPYGWPSVGMAGLAMMSLLPECLPAGRWRG